MREIRDRLLVISHVPPQKGDASSVITISSAIAVDAGNYTCEAKNGVKGPDGTEIIASVDVQVDVVGW